MSSFNSSKKVLFLSYVPRLHDPSVQRSGTVRPAASHRASSTAIVVERDSADQISIQGYAPVAYRDKHKCWSLFQSAVKQLLAVPRSVSVCIRLSDPPHSVISSLHMVLQVPSHVVNLTVSPLPSSASMTSAGPCSSASPTANTDLATFLLTKDERDPYCRYRDMYHNPHRANVVGRHKSAPTCTTKDSSGGFVRQKCNFAEMNRLLSQLAEVSLSLERTREECDMIAKRCPPRPSSSNRSQQCKCVCAEDEVDALRARAQKDGGTMQEATDGSVENLIHLAESLTEGMMKEQEQHEKIAASTMSVQHSSRVLPDCPTDVLVRPSFSDGCAYVMWNPVSLGIDETNQGHKVFGYLVYVDEQLWAESPGPLSSQVELDGLKHNTEYHIQVCTQAEQCNSLLSHPFTYSHVESKKPSSSKPHRLSARQIQDDSQVKAARVESWLKSSHQSQEIHNLSHCNETDSNSSLTPHVRFANSKETCTQLTQDLHSSRTASSSPTMSHKQYRLHTGSERDSPGAEDTKSITSSHTSGIVTDLPHSPKLSPACICAACTTSESFEVGHMIMSRCGHHHSCTSHHRHCGSQSSLMGTPSREGVACKRKSPHSSTSVTSSTVCPSPMHSAASSYMPDTVIDEPLESSTSKLELSERPSTTSRLPVPTAPVKGPFAYYGLTTPHKGPASPEDVRVVKKQNGYISVSWTPVRRDMKGCSSGFYVLGYRVYVNGSFLQSVDGAMKFETSLKCPLSNIQPPYHRLLIHVRTRSIAAESLPSNTVIFDLLLQRMVEHNGRTKPLDSVISTVDSVSLCTKTSASLLSHPVSKALSYPPTNNRRHVETFV